MFPAPPAWVHWVRYDLKSAVSQYIVIAPDGKRYGPTDFPTLAAWASDGRVLPGMMVEDLLSGQRMVASAVPGLTFGQTDQFATYPRFEPAKSTQSNTPLIAMILGLIGLVAWCLPIIGFPVSIVAIVMGAKSLNEDRPKALTGLILGIVCLLLSIANGILGAMMVMNGRGFG